MYYFEFSLTDVQSVIKSRRACTELFKTIIEKVEKNYVFVARSANLYQDNKVPTYV